MKHHRHLPRALLRAAVAGLAGLAVLACGAVGFAATAPRAGRVEFSDGSALAGAISITPGSELKIHLDNQVRTLAFERVREMRLEVENESLEQAYRMPEAGKAFRVAEGKPFPVRALKTTVSLAGGEALAGHLYTTVLYIESGDDARKVVLLAKQRGKEGQALKDLVYPVKVSFEDPGAPAGDVARLRLTLPETRGAGGVVALTLGALDRMEAKPSGGPGEYVLPGASGAGFFLAVNHGARVLVGWPRGPEEKAAAMVRAAFTNSEDFFDDRRVLAVHQDEPRQLIYSLVMSVRRGKTSLEEKKSQPWRLELYRWKLDDDGTRVMLAGKGYFFRGIDARQESVPTVELSPGLWGLKLEGGTWTTQ